MEQHSSPYTDLSEHFGGGSALHTRLRRWRLVACGFATLTLALGACSVKQEIELVQLRQLAELTQSAGLRSMPQTLVSGTPGLSTTCGAGLLPPKHAIAGVTPVGLQQSRGSCWLFAAVAMLEYSYRAQGVAAGWLKPNQYLQLSHQAFGVAVMDACVRQPAACLFDGDEVYTAKSTEGGEVTLLYMLRSLSNSSAMPHSVCPYSPTAGHDHDCPGLRTAQTTSPLRFAVRGMRTYYERHSIKQAVARGNLLALSMPVANVIHLLPCTEETAAMLHCDPTDRAQCHKCPMER